MEPKFHPAIAAIKAGNLDELKMLMQQDPLLATGRSSISHPTYFSVWYLILSICPISSN
jgi:hypothetical protein